MNEYRKTVNKIPKEQLSLKARCFHPSGTYIEFRREDIEQSIPERFEQQVRKYPNHLAVKTKSYQYSYDELNKFSNCLANALLDRLGEGEEPVLLLLEHDAPAIGAIFGVLKAGKIYVPLDPSYPKERIGRILADSGSALIITDSNNLSLARELAEERVGLLVIDNLDPKLPNENPGLKISPDALAYIIYTSGSTGLPKGVLEKHRNVLHFTMLFTNECHACVDDKFPLLASLSFSGSLSDIFTALLNGASLFPFDLRAEGFGNLVSWLIREGITIYDSVPIVFRQWAGTLSGEESFPELRMVRLGGDRVEKRDVELYKRFFPKSCIFRSGFGATEAKFMRQYLMDHMTPTPSDGVPVGYALDDIEVLLLDEEGQNAGYNQVGEIAIKSRFISPGYWKKPEITQSKFLPGPPGSDERIYLTGDLGRMLPDGCLFHLGRKDYQVKIRGHRIEVAEIETALLELEDIKEAVVVAREDHTGEQRLVAYLVSANQTEPTVSQLRRALSQKLPDYMVPSAFMMLEALPLNPNSKVDRNKLPKYDSLRPKLENEYLAPRGELEIKLIEIWKNVLGFRDIGVRDNLFDLGGNSLLATRLSNQIQKVFGETLPPVVLFQAPTVEQLADFIRQKGWSASWSSLVPIQPAGSKPPFFCVHPHTGYIIYYRDLACYLGSDQPFYGLQAIPLNKIRAQEWRFEDIAARYIKEIRTLQPNGPYFIGGLCLGGTMAFEMAQQLHGENEDVALLAMIQSTRPPYPKFLPSTTKIHRFIYRIIQRVDREVSVFFEIESKAKIPHLVQRIQRGLTVLYEKIKKTFKSLASKIGFRFKSSPVSSMEAIENAYVKAHENYEPRAYQGKVTLFKSIKQPLGIYPDDSLGWSELIKGNLEIIEVPGYFDQRILSEPRVRIVAKHLKDCLDKARKKRDSTDK